MTRRLATAALAAVLPTLLLGACTDDDDSDKPAATPESVLASAKEKLDETSGVRLTLDSKGMPDDHDGLLSATGVLTHAPAFDGQIVVQYSGFAPEVPIVAVDDKVYAQLPLTTGWQEIDPAEYGAPDPAALIDPDEGLSSFLTATTDVEKGKTVRGGSDNSEVLTSYQGTLPAETAAVIVPNVTGDVDATYTITDEGELRTARLTGDFYGTGASTTYTLTVEDYGIKKDITAP